MANSNNPFSRDFWSKESFSGDWSGLGQAGNWIGSTIDSLTGKAQADIARENLEHQKGLLDYQKGQWEETKSREDTAVQRRYKDLEAAGINPLLAAGSAAGSSSAPAMAAPQRSSGGAEAKRRGMLQAVETGRSLSEIYNIFQQARKSKAEADYLTGTMKDRMTVESIKASMASLDKEAREKTFEEEISAISAKYDLEYLRKQTAWMEYGEAETLWEYLEDESGLSNMFITSLGRYVPKDTKAKQEYMSRAAALIFGESKASIESALAELIGQGGKMEGLGILKLLMGLIR